MSFRAGHLPSNVVLALHRLQIMASAGYYPRHVPMLPWRWSQQTDGSPHHCLLKKYTTKTKDHEELASRPKRRKEVSWRTEKKMPAISGKPAGDRFPSKPRDLRNSPADIHAHLKLGRVQDLLPMFYPGLASSLQEGEFFATRWDDLDIRIKNHLGKQAICPLFGHFSGTHLT